MNERDQIWVEWLLGIFGTAGLFAALALIGMAAQGTKMGWLSYVLGALAFLVGPWFAVGIRRHALTGGIIGVGISVGALAVLLIFASLYDVAVPPLFVVSALFLGFMGGALGEPWLNTAA